jgi:hypothetical protein
MIFNDVDKTKPYTVLLVSTPVRLACLSFSGLARGVYYIQGDFRSKISKPHDKRLIQVGAVALRYVVGSEEFSMGKLVSSEDLPDRTSALPAFSDIPEQKEGSNATGITVAGPTLPPVRVVEYSAPAPLESIPVVQEVAAPVVRVAPEPPVTPELPQAVVGALPKLSDDEPIVVLDDKPKKRRGRKPKSAQSVASAAVEAKLDGHDQDSATADEGVPAAPSEDRVDHQDS